MFIGLLFGCLCMDSHILWQNRPVSQAPFPFEGEGSGMGSVTPGVFITRWGSEAFPQNLR